MNIHMHTYTRTYIHMHTYTYTHTYIHITHTHTHTCTHIHAHTYTCTHAHTHTRSHTRPCRAGRIVGGRRTRACVLLIARTHTRRAPGFSTASGALDLNPQPGVQGRLKKLIRVGRARGSEDWLEGRCPPTGEEVGSFRALRIREIVRTCFFLEICGT